MKLALLLALAFPLAAQPRITDGTVTTARFSGDLATQVVALGDGWNGYAVPTTGHHYYSACSDGDDVSINDGDLRVAASNQLLIFYRVAAGRIERIRFHSTDCALDANGSTVHWIEGVPGRASAALLRTLVDSERERVAKTAVVALALHDDSTTDTLIDIARHHKSSAVRANALFWLGQRAGERAVATLREAVDNDPEASVRERAVFGISQLPDDRSIPMLIELMKTHRSPGVRKKAAFWLGQKRDPRALAALEEILR
ncbi:MAG TPA: HEAT repeat domain-containing protein [Thermoanaerobaculia bacterium]|jgi:HEAT repeat protein|nr:HEAT repeat domain-containing protein [Thermoanaerobaculia bacterium]